MWQALIPVIANLVTKNSPGGAKAVNTAMQAMRIFPKKGPTE